MIGSLLLLACRVAPGTSTPTDQGVDETAAPPPPGPTLAASAAAAGWTVQPGVFEFSRYENCCLPGASCLWNNPSTPYGVVAVPPGPGQLVPDPDSRTDGLSRNYHLRPDEAVVVLGRTPPRAKYFGYRSYLSYRQLSTGPALVIGSLGPSLNQQVVARWHGEDAVFDQPFAIVSTADAAVEAEVVDWLVQSGWDPTHVHPDRIPGELVRLGLDALADTFSIVARVAVYADPVAGEAFLDDPGATVLRLTPPGPAPFVPARPHPVASLPARGAGADESAWAEALGELSAAIGAAYPDHLAIEQVSNPWHYETYDCLEDAYCSGEIRDRYYARVPNFTLPDDGSFLVVYGVNHERSGRASYANFAVDTVINEIGVDAVESDAFVGSARFWLPDHPQVDDLYAWVIARSCADRQEPCLEVPTGCPGVDYDESLLVSFRAYLDPVSGAAPLPAELIQDRAVKFFPGAMP